MPVTLTSKSKSQSKKQSADQELLEKSFKRFKITAESEAETRRRALEDLRFSVGEGQWDAAIKAEREIEGRPCLTVNRIPTFLRQYTGEERQHRPGMIVNPVGNGSDVDTAEILQGALRHCEVVSFADTIYDYNYDFMLRAGFGNWRVNPEYINEKSFDQEPRIQLIENPFAVWMSPIRQPDGSDPLWAHVTEDMSHEEYLAKYPKSQMAKYKSQWGRLRFASELGNAEPDWVTRDGIRIAEYWWLELEPRELLQLGDGTVVFADEFTGDKGMIVDRRDSVSRTVKNVKHNSAEVLETYEYVGRYIPLVEINGVRLNINGKIWKAGMVRDAVDPQRLYNFMITGEAEMIGLAPKDPLMVAEGSIAGHEEEYRMANRKNYPYLYYKAYDDEGKQIPPPQRPGREPPIEAMSKMVQQSDYDLKSVIGIYGPGLGEQGPAQESGFAILKRQQQSDTGSVNWSDNLHRAIRWQAKILLDLYPKLVSAPRLQRLIDPDQSVQHAAVFNSQNSPQGLPDAQALARAQGLKKCYDIGVGDYDVELSTGPTYKTARQEQFAALTEVIKSDPQMISIVGDFWARSADWHGARELADRFKRMLPANLQDASDDDPASQLTLLQGQIAQLGAQHQQLVAELGRASDTIRTKRLELESRERIAALNAQAGMIEAMIKAKNEAAQAALESALGTISHRMELLHESMTIDQEAGDAPITPELPGKVEPKSLPVTPGQTPPPVPGTSGTVPTA